MLINISHKIIIRSIVYRSICAKDSVSCTDVVFFRSPCMIYDIFTANHKGKYVNRYYCTFMLRPMSLKQGKEV